MRHSGTFCYHVKRSDTHTYTHTHLHDVKPHDELVVHRQPQPPATLIRTLEHVQIVVPVCDTHTHTHAGIRTGISHALACVPALPSLVRLVMSAVLMPCMSVCVCVCVCVCLRMRVTHTRTHPLTHLSLMIANEK